MTFSIAHLGPAGTYAEQAALDYAQLIQARHGSAPSKLVAEPSITQTIYALDQDRVDLAVVPVENSIEGSVSFTLDTVWRVPELQIHEAFILPIDHMFISLCSDLKQIEAVYSHPQPLGQCQAWLTQNVPQAQLMPTPSTSEALRHIKQQKAGAIASKRAAEINQLPIQYRSIQDHPDNCTKFWVLKKASDSRLKAPDRLQSDYTSLAFSLPHNVPGALLAPLTTFSDRQINLSRIESRPAKTSLGDYVFFIDAEVKDSDSNFQAALDELRSSIEVLKLLGSYPLTSIP